MIYAIKVVGMIKNIHIGNYALIDKTNIELEKGFTIITGETGAGKSILLGAIGLTLGQRADVAAIMDKNRKCVVEITYDVVGYDLQQWFACLLYTSDAADEL